MMVGMILLSVCVVGLTMAAMAVGVMFSNRCLRGSCGGRDTSGSEGESLRCDSCPRRRGGYGK